MTHGTATTMSPGSGRQMVWFAPMLGLGISEAERRAKVFVVLA